MAGEPVVTAWPDAVARELAARTDIKVGGTAIVDSAEGRWYFRRLTPRPDAWKLLSIDPQRRPGVDRANDLTPEQIERRKAERTRMDDLLERAAEHLAASAKPATEDYRKASEIVRDWTPVLEPGILEEAVENYNQQRVADMLQRAGRAAVDPNENEHFVHVSKQGPNAAAAEAMNRHIAESVRVSAALRQKAVETLARGSMLYQHILDMVAADGHRLYDPIPREKILHFNGRRLEIEFEFRNGLSKIYSVEDL